LAGLVLVDSPGLVALAPDAGAFAGHFTPSQTVAAFANLGGDARLVAPAPQGPMRLDGGELDAQRLRAVSPAAYAHLAAFARQALISPQHALWPSFASTRGRTHRATWVHMTRGALRRLEWAC
jgi:hypothetical protein